MRVAVFPFEIKRIDAPQGVLGRQGPRAIVEALRAAGIAGERPQWYTRAGDGAAHVTVEAPLPINVVDEACDDLDATHAVLGRVHVTGHRAYLSLALASEEGTHTGSLEATTLFDESAPRDALPTLIRSAAAALIHALTGDASSVADDDAPTLEAWLVDATADDGRDLDMART